MITIYVLLILSLVSHDFPAAAVIQDFQGKRSFRPVMASLRASPARLVRARGPRAGRGILSQSRSTTCATDWPQAAQVPRRTSWPLSILPIRSTMSPASRQLRNQALPRSMACSLGGIRSIPTFSEIPLIPGFSLPVAARSCPQAGFSSGEWRSG